MAVLGFGLEIELVRWLWLTIELVPEPMLEREVDR